MRKTFLILSIMVAASLFNTTAFASVNDDQVTSQKIREADGTSGQNTNSGSGVKTGHIQDGAVTNAKIGGTISQSKVTGLEAALAGKSEVTHNHDVLYQQKYGKVAVVAQTGGDYGDPIAAMNDLATWCGTPAATNPCLVKIMPGVYNVGNDRVVMINYVDIEGSGENVTKILGSTNILGGNIGLVEGASNAELRNLTVENSGGYWVPKAICNTNASPKLTNITVISAGAPTGNYGIENRNSSPIMTNVTVYLSGRSCQAITNNSASSARLTNVNITTACSDVNVGITNNSSSPILNNVTVSASGGSQENYGMLNFTSTPTIINSSLSGNGASGAGVYNAWADNITTIFNSIISGSEMNIRGELTKCINVVDASFNPITCQ